MGNVVKVNEIVRIVWAVCRGERNSQRYPALSGFLVPLIGCDDLQHNLAAANRS